MPDAKEELIRHYTFSDTDLSIIRQRRGPANRLGFAVQLCYLRYPGRALYADEVIPEPLLVFIAAQLACAPGAFADYGRARDTKVDHTRQVPF